MAEILHYDGITRLAENPETLLDKAKDWGMERCVVIGYDDNDKMLFGGSFSELGDILMLLELAKKFVIDNEFIREI